MDFQKSFSDFFKKWIIQPGFEMGRSFRVFLKSLGILDSIDLFIYNNIEDPLLYYWFTNAYDLKIINDDVIPRKGEGNCIFASNHQSIMDPLVSGLAIVHNSKRVPFQLTKAELGENPLLGNFVSMNQVIYIKRGTNDTEALDKCVHALTELDRPVLVYPEGTYGPGDGTFLPFKTGVVRIAWKAKVPIIPMATWGIDKIMDAEASRKMNKMPASKGKLRVKFGEPIELNTLFPDLDPDSEPTKEQYNYAVNIVQRKVHDLWKELDENERNPSK